MHGQITGQPVSGGGRVCFVPALQPQGCLDEVSDRMGLKQLWLDLLGLRPRRMQVAAACLRDGDAGTEVLLVTTRDSGRWILPKGWPVRGRSLAGSAAQEAWEEAGVRGVVGRAPLGRHVDFKHFGEGFGQQVQVVVFAIRQVELDAIYPEVGQRQRRWFSLEEAAGRVDDPALADLLRGLSSQ